MNTPAALLNLHLDNVVSLRDPKVPGTPYERSLLTTQQRIEAAIARYGAGRGGLCVTCGGSIEPERLERLPYAERCFDCQRAVEVNQS